MIERRFCHHDPVEYEYRCTEYEYDQGYVFLRIPGLRLVARVVLVLSIAVLVLVIETLLGYSVGSLYQSSEHRHDPF